MLKNPLHIYGGPDPLVPGHLNFGVFILEKLHGYKDKTALINASTHESVSYSEIVQHSMNFAISLTRMGVRKGDVIGLMSENRNEFWGAVIGAICSGATVALISPNYMQDELKNALHIAKPKLIISCPSVYQTHSERINSFPSLEKVILFGDQRLENTVLYSDLVAIKDIKYEDFKAVDVNGQTDTLFIVYSSGTTGMPKERESYADTSKCNTSVFFIEQLGVVPPVLVAVTKWPGTHDLSSVQLISSGAAPLSKDTLQAVHKKFPNLKAVLQGYGASETTLAATKFVLSDIEVSKRKLGSVGRVVDGFTVKVVDIETRKPLGPNQRGEICVKGAMLMKGYVGKEETKDFDEEGFYKMGDIGYYDDDGFFYIVDRLKELIKYKGHQVPPAELESLLLTHPAVKDVGVIGIPHTTSGEVPLAYVVPQTGMTVTERELQDFVAERLSSPKHLRGGVRFLDQVPKSPSGKILRKELRDLYRATTSKL